MKIPKLCSQHFDDGCMRLAKARGMCGKHIQRFYSHGDPSVTLTMREHGDVCTVPECDRPYYARGFCRLHRDRDYAHGSPTLADDLIVAQGGVCRICRRPPRGRGHESRLHLDHDHNTGRTRGMLCGPCNKAIGLLGDDPALVQAALDYLTLEEASCQF